MVNNMVAFVSIIIIGKAYALPSTIATVMPYESGGILGAWLGMFS